MSVSLCMSTDVSVACIAYVLSRSHGCMDNRCLAMLVQMEIGSIDRALFV
jgi:hypothetical protein